MEVTRDKAWNDLKEYVDSESLIKHSLTVEAAMMKMADVYGEDKNTWGCCGLLHDIDFEKFPKEHCFIGPKWLLEKGYAQEFCDAIKGHNDETHTPRESKMAKTLYAVDQLSSFIIACALVRPEKLTGMTSKSVKKKVKDKAFARAVDRDNLQLSTAELGEDFTVMIDYLIDGLTQREAELNEMGFTLL